MEQRDVSEQSSIRIGNVDYKLGSADTYGRRHLEVTSKHSEHIYPKLLLLEQLSDLRLKDLPQDLGITISRPNTPLNILESIDLRSGFYQGNLCFTVFYSSESWKSPTNLWHHTKSLAGKILSDIEDSMSAEVLRDQGCTWVNVSCRIPENTLIVDYIVGMEKRIDALIKELENKSGATQPGPKESSLKPDERGLKWWLRYVIVPIIGGSTLIALLKMALGQA